MADLIDRDLTIHELEAFKESRSANLLRMSFDDVIDVVNGISAANRWIPCSERLPEDFVWCLVCMSDGCIRIGKWNGEYDEQGVWWVSHPNSGGKLYRKKNVPYWMPLPEPPEKE